MAMAEENPMLQMNTEAEPTSVEDRVDPARKHLVKRWTDAVDQAKAHWSDQFDQMRKDELFARGEQWDHDTKEEKYVANVTLQHVQQRVSDLYARNPRVAAHRADRLQYKYWDETSETLTTAQTLIQAAAEGQEVDPAMVQTAQLIVQDAQDGYRRNQMLSKIGQTMKRAFHYQMKEQPVPFKQQMKNMVRRATTTGVGYIHLNFQRQLGMSPDIQARIQDVQDRLQRIERLQREMADGDYDQESPEAEELRQQLQVLENQEKVIVREGLIFDFPRSTEIIPDPKCTNVIGFLGCDWVAREYLLTTAQIEEIYGVDVSDSFDKRTKDKTPGHRNGSVIEMMKAQSNAERGRTDGEDEASWASVYEIYSKKDGMVHVVCAGYPDYLLEPTPPDTPLDRFWPFFVYALNPIDCDENPYPPSDVQLIKHMQKEINRSRQGLREHRRAARPKIIVPQGRLSESDKDLLQAAPEDGLPVLELLGLQPGEKVQDLLQAWNPPGVDPNLYDVNQAFTDIMRTVGTQEANLGGTSGATATESSISEQSRQKANTSAVDDLDELLSELARCSGQVMLTEMSAETIREIVGPGAVWPELTYEEVAKEVYLEIEAGSTGRPNQAVELQTAERITPLLLQIPGISPEWLAKELLRRMDDNLSIEDAFAPGMPSIQSLNQKLSEEMKAGQGAGQGADQEASQGADQGPQPGSQPTQAAQGAQEGGDPNQTPQEAPGGPQDQMRPGPLNQMPGQTLAIR